MKGLGIRYLTIVVRTRREDEIDEYYRYGASQVISEELETSVEIFSSVLEVFRIPRNMIQMQVDLVRQDSYSMLRGLSLSAKTLANLPDIISKTVVDSFVILEGSPWAEKTLGELNLYKQSGALVISVVRNLKTTTNPNLNYKFAIGDVLVMVGSHAQLDQALSILKGSEE